MAEKRKRGGDDDDTESTAPKNKTTATSTILTSRDDNVSLPTNDGEITNSAGAFTKSS